MSLGSKAVIDQLLNDLRVMKNSADEWRESSSRAWSEAHTEKRDNQYLRKAIYALLGAVVLHWMAFAVKVLW